MCGERRTRSDTAPRSGTVGGWLDDARVPTTPTPTAILLQCYVLLLLLIIIIIIIILVMGYAKVLAPQPPSTDEGCLVRVASAYRSAERRAGRAGAGGLPADAHADALL